MKKKVKAKPEKEKARANEGEFQSRVLAVLEWLRFPLTREEILNRSKGWKLQPRQIDNYIHEAKELLRQSFLEGLEENKAIIVSKFWKIYDMAIHDGHPKYDKLGIQVGNDPDYSAANAALKNIAHIQGLLVSKVDLGLSADSELEDVPTEILISYGKSHKKDPVTNNHNQVGSLQDPP